MIWLSGFWSAASHCNGGSSQRTLGSGECGPSHWERQDARDTLAQGESLQGWADALAAATAALPDAQLTAAAEASARADTLRHYERAVQAYQQVHAVLSCMC